MRVYPPINTATVQHLDRGQNRQRFRQRLTEDDPRRSSLAVFQVPQIPKLDRRGDPACGGALVEPERMGDLAELFRRLLIYDYAGQARPGPSLRMR